MKVLVVGSRRHLDASQADQRTKFAEACRAMGKAFAEKGHTLIVGTDDPEDSDAHFVEGANEVRGSRVIVSRPDTDQRGTPYGSVGKKFDNVTFAYRPRRGEWTSVQLHALSEADVLVLVGGRKTAEATGYSAAAVRRPVLAVPSFGGAAHDVWSEVQRYYREGGISQDDEGTLQMDWSQGAAAVVVRSAESLVKNTFRSKGYGAQIGTLLATLALMAGWVALFQRSQAIGPDASFYSMLVIAALLGTNLRTTLRLIGDGRWDARMILSEAGAGILIAFGFALLYWAGVVVIKGDVPTIEAKDFRRVAISMSMLGFAAAFLLNEAAASLSERMAETLKGRAPGAK